MMGHMPAIPESTRDSITWRLILHAQENWPQLDKVQVTCRGGFAYAAGVLPGGDSIPLFRLRYGGSAHSFGFAIYSAARDRYQDAVLLTGLPIGSPQEALDNACREGTPQASGDHPACYAKASSSSRQARSQRRQASAQTRQCGMWACRSHSSPQPLQMATQASSSGRATVAS